MNSNTNKKRKYIDNSFKNSDLSFDTDLCYYTLNQGRKFLHDYTNMSSDPIEIILQYSAIYRKNHKQGYRFFSTKFKTLIKHLLSRSINLNKVSMISIPNRFDIIEIVINLLLFKEIECKINNKPYNILISTGHKTIFREKYQALRISLNETWMLKDTIVDTKDMLITNNNFKVYCTEEFIKNVHFDIIIRSNALRIRGIHYNHFNFKTFTGKVILIDHEIDNRRIEERWRRLINYFQANRIYSNVELISVLKHRGCTRTKYNYQVIDL